MNGLADLRMFSEIAGAETMAGAASRLGLSPATISGRLKALEEHYGVSLVRRTTRSLSLTEEGRLLLERARPLLDGFEDLERTMGRRKHDAQGSLVISSPLDFGRRHIAPLVGAFCRGRPDVEFDLRFEHGEPAPDMRFDVAFRIGTVRGSNLITRRLTDLRTVTCAAPRYLARHGVPATPAALKAHHCLLHASAAGRGDAWVYKAGGGSEAFRVTGRHAASDMSVLIALAVEGQGIVRAPADEIAEPLARGALVPLLAPFEPEPQPVQLLSEPRRLLPSRTVQFIDFVVEHFRRAERTGESDDFAAARYHRDENTQQNDGVKFFFLQNVSKKISSLSHRRLAAVPD